MLQVFRHNKDLMIYHTCLVGVTNACGVFLGLGVRADLLVCV